MNGGVEVDESEEFSRGRVRVLLLALKSIKGTYAENNGLMVGKDLFVAATFPKLCT